MTTIDKRLVLYIEDNKTNIQLVGLLLKKLSGVEYVSVEDPRDGLQLAQELLPTLILLDISMPEMSGYEVLEQLRQHPSTKHIPVIAVTANCTESDAVKGLAAGFDQYLTKPLNAVRFLETVQDYLPMVQIHKYVTA